MRIISSRPLFCFPGFVTFAVLLALVSCSDDTPVSIGPSDHTAPQIVALTPIDEYHVDVAFDEELDAASAQDWKNYTIVETNAAPSTTAPGDQLYPAPILRADHKTVSLTTWYSMKGLPLELSLTGIKDVHGNSIAATKKSFAGSDQPDVDPPTIVSSTPSDGSTGAPIGTAVVIHFSELLDQGYYEANVAWTSPAGPVDYYFSGQYSSGSIITLISRQLLGYDQAQTILLTGLKDRSGNPMPDTQLSFTTATVVDKTRPTLVSSYPLNGAVNVDNATTISLTFSEPVNRYDFRIDTVPQILFDTWTWSNDERTITYSIRDDLPLYDNQQYMIAVYPAGVFDLAGNTLADYQSVLFTTGSKLEQGQIAGRVKGDPNTQSANPAGAVVIAENYAWDTYNFAKVSSSGSYAIRNLTWGPHYVRAFFDSNGDGIVNIETGDALGGYGANVDAGEFELEPVPLGEGDRRSNIDFQIYDPAAASGYTSYSGTAVLEYRPVEIGLFANAEDAAQLQNPLFVYDDWWAPWKRKDEEYPDWVFNQFDQLFDDGTYYVAAYLDADSSLTYDPVIDPAGVYGGFDSPTALVMFNGKDYPRITITMSDPAPTTHMTSGVTRRAQWPAPVKNAGFQQFADALAKAQVAGRTVARE